MSLKQLNTLFRVENDREQQAAQELQQAEFDYQQNKKASQKSISEFIEFVATL